MAQHKHFGWLVSPYSAKTRVLLRAAGVSFIDIEPTALQMSRQIKPNIGRIIMPTMRLSDGRWLQDSSNIADEFWPPESSPYQHVAARLIEFFADEWLPMLALHYRWNIPENRAYALSEFARTGFPRLPGIIGRPLVQRFANKMQSYLPALGVDERTHRGVEATARTLIELLEAHFRVTAFLLGQRPSLGDFALFGPLWAHLYRDPGSRFLFDSAPAVQRWMTAIETIEPSVCNTALDERPPPTIEPLLEFILGEQWPWVRTLVAAIDNYLTQHPDAQRLPRSLGTADFEIAGCAGSRKLATAVLWKAQRVLDAVASGGSVVRAWLERFEPIAQYKPSCQFFPHPKRRLVYSNLRLQLE